MSIAAVIGAFFGYCSKPSTQNVITFGGQQSTTKQSKLQQIIDIINTCYVDSVNIDSITEEMIPQLLENLDPHSVYIPVEDLRHVNDELRSDFGGIGVTFILREDTINVISVISGGPSSRVGVIPGDKIVGINGHDFVGDYLDNNMVMDSLRGQIGTPVQISVIRDGKTRIDFDIIRDVIPMYSVVSSYMIDETVGYMKIDRFAEKTYEEMMTNLAKLNQQGCQTIVVDLRSNSGGLLDVVIRMCNEFLALDESIVYTDGLHHDREEIHANGKGNFQNMNVVVLIDEFSASASEIFAGAMQDNDRGVVVGRRSFGKGLVQSQVELVDGSAMRVTIARYYTPSGRCIQKPYDGSNEDYYNDVYSRYFSSEAYCADSMKIDESKTYYTRNGRKVFGGGGIIPDVFVPSDTSRASYYLIMLRNKALFHTYAVEYANRNREKLSAMQVNELIDYLENENILPAFVEYARKRGITTPSISKTERPYIDGELKANIARNINEEAYYPIINRLDKSIEKAVEIAQPAQ